MLINEKLIALEEVTSNTFQFRITIFDLKY